MHDTVSERAERAKALAPRDRFRLVDVLLVSLHGEPLAQIESVWDDQVERRLSAYDRGEVQAVDGEEVLPAARALAGR